jgi:hypothetical protein
MKKLLFFFLLLLIRNTLAAPIYDTIYHPVYNKQQLIELRLHSNNLATKGFITTQQNDLPFNTIPKYLLRNDKGEEIIKYNDFDNTLFANQLKPVGTTQIKPHQLKTKNTSSYIGYDDSGYNIIYPVYSCKPSDNGICIEMKIGLIDTLGTLVLPIQFNHIQWIDSVFITQEKNSYSLYSFDFKQLLKDYQSINYINTNRDHILLKKNNQYGLINRDGKYLLSMEFEEIRESKYMHGYYEYFKNGLWGFANFNFSRILEPFSPSPYLFQRDGYFQYCDDKKLWTVIDSTGRIYLKSPLEMYQVLSPSRFLVTKYDREEGYQRSISDAFGNIISDKIYYDIWRVNPTTLIAGYDASIHDASNLKKSAKWILLDFNGNKKNEKIYKGLLPLDETWIKAWDSKGNLNVIDGLGNDALGYSIEDIYKYSTHVYKIKIDGKHQFLDLQHPQYISKPYDNLICISENRFGVQKDGLWGFINGFTLKEIFPISAEKITCFKNGIASVKMGENWILIDSLGQVYSKDAFKQTTLLDDGFAKVEKNGKYGIIDKDGQYAIPAVYDEMKFIASQKNETFIGVKWGDKYGIINLKNEIVYPFIFETCAEISVHASIPQNRQAGFYAFLTITKRATIEYYYLNFDPSKNLITTQRNHTAGFKIITKNSKSNSTGKCMGVVNWEGKEIIPCSYVLIRDFKYNTFQVSSAKGIGLMDTLGHMLIPPVYAYMYELGRDTTLLQVGRHSGTWGLYSRSGKRIADTIYGGFEEPVGSLIPFYADFNFRVVNHSWEHDEKRIGLMDFSGNILIKPMYDRINRDYPKKGQIRLAYGDNYCIIDDKGKLIEGQFNTATFQKPTSEPTQPTKSKKKKRKKRIRWL